MKEVIKLYSFRMIYEYRGKEECWFIEAANINEAKEQMKKEHRRKAEWLIDAEPI